MCSSCQFAISFFRYPLYRFVFCFSVHNQIHFKLFPQHPQRWKIYKNIVYIHTYTDLPVFLEFQKLRNYQIFVRGLSVVWPRQRDNSARIFRGNCPHIKFAVHTLCRHDYMLSISFEYLTASFHLFASHPRSTR